MSSIQEEVDRLKTFMDGYDAALQKVLALPELQDEHDASNQYERVDEVARNTLRASIRAAIERMK